jgi:hypothetical protein
MAHSILEPAACAAVDGHGLLAKPNFSELLFSSPLKFTFLQSPQFIGQA